MKTTVMWRHLEPVRRRDPGGKRRTFKRGVIWVRVGQRHVKVLVDPRKSGFLYGGPNGWQWKQGYDARAIKGRIDNHIYERAAVLVAVREVKGP